MQHVKRTSEAELFKRAKSFEGKYVTTTDGVRFKVYSAIVHAGTIVMAGVDTLGRTVYADNEHATIDRNQDEAPSSEDYHHGNH